MIRIEKKIVGYDVVKPEDEAKEKKQVTVEQAEQEVAKIIRMHEKIERPEGMEALEGATYKIKTPLDEHALYVTINDIVLNKGTENEKRRPFEVFINSKNMDHFQWIVALTRVMSAVFRKGGDVTFMVEELQAVFDPRGGYYKPGGKFMPSLVAEIGAVVEDHLKRIGLLEDDSMTPEQLELIKLKREELEGKPTGSTTQINDGDGDYPASATLCHKCNTKAMVVMDNCATCLSCGYSKCG